VSEHAKGIVKTALCRIWEEVGGLVAERADLAVQHDKLVERSVGAMAIAEGDEGYEKIPLDCPMLVAVSELRDSYRRLKIELDETRSDRQREHDLRVRLAGEESLCARLEHAEIDRDAAAELLVMRNSRIRDLEAELAEATARQMGLIYYVPSHVTAGAIQDARKAWLDLQAKAGKMEALLRRHPIDSDGWVTDRNALLISLDTGTPLPSDRLERLEAAANEVLRVYMPQFNDSRAVDDCLVGLAAAVSGA
jgi:hypothetical protein